MKTVTPSQLVNTLEDIVVEREKRAKSVGQSFEGVTPEQLIEELTLHIGDDWSVKKDSPVRFTKEDINAVANSRFYRKSGIKILLIWAIILLAILTAMSWFPAVHLYIYYGLLLATVLGFVWYYGKRQRASRKELWEGIEGDGIESDREAD